jgi:GTP cyclohydrolase II
MRYYWPAMIDQPTSGRLRKPSIEEILEHAAEDRDVRVSAVAELPTRFGDFQVVAFHAPAETREHAALVKGDIDGAEDVPVRLHSECLTGDTFGSLRCDCREQLETSLRMIEAMPMGVVLYLRQEGRGIGLENKIRAYQLQEAGFDTNEANTMLGFREDERDYEIAADMLKAMGVRSIRLISNNPDKMADLQRHGVRVTGRIPIDITANEHNAFYLETKRRNGHLLAPAETLIGEQIDCVHRTSNQQPRLETADAAA